MQQSLLLFVSCRDSLVRYSSIFAFVATIITFYGVGSPLRFQSSLVNEKAIYLSVSAESMTAIDSSASKDTDIIRYAPITHYISSVEVSVARVVSNGLQARSLLPARWDGTECLHCLHIIMPIEVSSDFTFVAVVTRLSLFALRVFIFRAGAIYQPTVAQPCTVFQIADAHVPSHNGFTVTTPTAITPTATVRRCHRPDDWLRCVCSFTIPGRDAKSLWRRPSSSSAVTPSPLKPTITSRAPSFRYQHWNTKASCFEKNALSAIRPS